MFYNAPLLFFLLRVACFVNWMLSTAAIMYTRRIVIDTAFMHVWYMLQPHHSCVDAPCSVYSHEHLEASSYFEDGVASRMPHRYQCEYFYWYTLFPPPTHMFSVNRALVISPVPSFPFPHLLTVRMIKPCDTHPIRTLEHRRYGDSDRLGYGCTDRGLGYGHSTSDRQHVRSKFWPSDAEQA